MGAIKDNSSLHITLKYDYKKKSARIHQKIKFMNAKITIIFLGEVNKKRNSQMEEISTLLKLASANSQEPTIIGKNIPSARNQSPAYL